ncbi:MAG: geranylgeranylglycerol-phosphate geranylgeranyltransferase [Bacteroidales bacterium]|nr:geranylgeranylglycerol-phosphate geranylgeranyltransferase [Bacteroidales bacterium]
MIKRILKKSKFSRGIKGFFYLIRPLNLFIIGFTAFLTWQALLGGLLENFNKELHLSPENLIFLILSIILVGAGGYIINDYFDTTIDEINKPGKQIIGKSISASRALVIYGIVTAAGIIFAFIPAIRIGNYQIAMLHIIFALALWFYSEQFKYIKFWGNFVVSLSTAFVVIVMWLYEFFAMVNDNEILIGQESRMVNYFVLGYAAFAFISNFARELVKDRQDVPGDIRAGVKSLAVTMSDKGFRILVYVTLGVNFFMLLLAQIYLYKMELILVSWYLFLPEFMLIYLTWVLSKAGMEKDYANMSLYMKAYILAGILSMQVLYISW